MTTYIRYSAAERKSFELQAETCPVVEQAIEDAFEPPSLDAPGVESILRHYGIDPNDKKMCMAIREVMHCAAFPIKKRLKDIILHKATMPLRAALVEQVKVNMAATGERTDPRNRFQEWVESWERRNHG